VRVVEVQYVVQVKHLRSAHVIMNIHHASVKKHRSIFINNVQQRIATLDQNLYVV
jgi:hypothetical protein